MVLALHQHARWSVEISLGILKLNNQYRYALHSACIRALAGSEINRTSSKIVCLSWISQSRYNIEWQEMEVDESKEYRVTFQNTIHLIRCICMNSFPFEMICFVHNCNHSCHHNIHRIEIRCAVIGWKSRCATRSSIWIDDIASRNQKWKEKKTWTLNAKQSHANNSIKSQHPICARAYRDTCLCTYVFDLHSHNQNRKSFVFAE